MPNIFRKAKVRAPGYSWFDMSHENKLTLEIGKNVPVFNAHVFPGDRWVVGKEHLLRFMPMLAPVYQRFDVRFDTCFIPERIIWDKSKDFYRGGKDGVTDVPVPSVKLLDLITNYYNSTVNSTGIWQNQVNFLTGSLLDYMNLPTFEYLITSSITSGSGFLQAIITELTVNSTANKDISLIPFFCYQSVYREYYRDQFVQENSTDSPTLTSSYTSYLPEIEPEDFLSVAPDASNAIGIAAWKALLILRNVDYPKDYFTSAFPTPQLGADVNIPVSSVLRVGNQNSPYVQNHTVSNTSGSGINTSRITTTASGNTMVTGQFNIVNAGTIRDLRKANRLQEYNEKGLLGGNRFIDWILAHFGVHSSDARLDRPEMISRSKSAVTISDVTSQSPDAYGSDSAAQPLGSLAGQGISVSGDPLCDYFVEEPGWLQVYVSVVPRAAYFQGIPKEMFKMDRFDMLIPEFAEIGEQPIDSVEIHTAQGSNVFGYTERYAEYKFMPSEIHGDFRYSLSYWHAARMFGSQPVLNGDFLQVNAGLNDLNRIFAYPGNYRNTDDNHLLMAVYFDVKAYRALPLYPRYQM